MAQQLFAELNTHLHAAQAAAARGDSPVAGLNADQFQAVVQKIEDRVIGSLDNSEPELAEETLREMKAAVSEVHKTEGFPKGKIAGARNTEPDWLTKIVAGNAKMQSMIEQLPEEDRIAIADS